MQIMYEPKEHAMKVSFLAPLFLGVVLAINQAYSESRSNPVSPKRVRVSELTPDLDGTEVIMRFTIEKTIWLSGSVPKDRARSFMIETSANSDEPPFSVLVMGEIADAMERFRYAPPQHGDPARGLVVEARGYIKVYAAPEKSPNKETSYQLRIADLNGFRITARPKR